MSCARSNADVWDQQFRRMAEPQWDKLWPQVSRTDGEAFDVVLHDGSFKVAAHACAL